MTKPLDGKCAIVTGASRGIGRAVCARLAAMGAGVTGVDIALDDMEQTAAEVQAAGARFMALQANVCDSDALQDAVKRVVEAFGSADVMVNNAGITRDGLLIRMSEEDWQAVLNVNLTGVFNGTKAVARQMMKQREGRIINVASVVGIIGNAGQANYSASKAGVIGLTKTTAREFAGRNINVNAVAPGFIETAMTDKLSDDAREALSEQIPLGRMGTPQDVAAVAGFLAGPDSAYMTGQVLRVDGGMVM